MPIIVDENYFSFEHEALAEIARDGYWHRKLDAPPQQGNPHRHNCDARFYVLSGVATLTDVEAGTMYTLYPRSRAVIPEGIVHFETLEMTLEVIYATSIDPGLVVDLPPR